MGHPDSGTAFHCRFHSDLVHLVLRDPIRISNVVLVTHKSIQHTDINRSEKVLIIAQLRRSTEAIAKYKQIILQ